jgi:hypothetical protein
VLDKTSEGERVAREVLRAHRNQLEANTQLSSVTRAIAHGEDELVKLYPLLPYQVQLLIDAVSARRAHGGASPTVGGSNRTLIKHAQALLVHPDHGLASHEVGALVTLDRSYDLLEEMIPTSWRAEVNHVARRYGDSSIEVALVKVIALCADVRALPLSAPNLAVLLHPSVGAESMRDQVEAGLAHLVADDRVRQSGDGYSLQSPEQKDWERDRRAVDLAPGQAVRIRRELLGEVLATLSVSRGRAFSVGLVVEGEKLSDGQLQLEVVEALPNQRDTLRSVSRETANANRVKWVHEVSPATWDALRELHRSKTIIERRDRPNKTATEVELLGQERQRLSSAQASALSGLREDLCAGQCIFRGQIEDLPTGTERDLRSVAQGILSRHLDDIYPALGDFEANVRSADALTLLRADSLDGLPDSLGPDGIRLLRMTPSGLEIVSDGGPLDTLIREVRARAAFGQEATGGHLEHHFGAPPYGARVEVVEVCCAAAIRAGLLEVVHQGQRLVNRGDRRLDQVFSALPRFRAAAFRPPSESDVALEVRVELAERLDHLAGGQRPTGMGTDAVAAALRTTFGPLRETCARVSAALSGAGLELGEVVRRTSQIAERLCGPDDAEVVMSAHGTWADLVAGRQALLRLEELVNTELSSIREAAEEARRNVLGLPAEAVAKHAELAELVQRADLVGDWARVSAITARLGNARRAATSDAAERLTALVKEARSALASAAPGVAPAALAEVLRPIEALLPPLELSGLSAEVLEARIEAVPRHIATAWHQIEELAAAGPLAWVRVSALAGALIHDTDELDAALSLIRQAAIAELSAGKRVRLQ